MSMPSGMELILIFGIIVLLFGAKKIPDLAKGLGQGIKNFKKEMKNDDAEASDVKTAQTDAPKKVEADKDIASKESPKTTQQA
ncbi:MAG: preprotein translocase subunit TatA [Sulfurimonas sp. RIFCSPHIGHO2_12_FULL_36_9]|uniref:Sec-independent protein translocase subunit TatA/TatB n=1 Tax=unclassified Sulfurimonas TaxID=2623549 RepID=UPI0008B716C0|nr:MULTISPECIES: twin-arginine translocase TatA/TatE family subunit [unclassified Sulfurimonas]OHD98133.1 MAG: preprotein translocase subunit TatA [Sulfurimonas sp. RIFCSPLOWO2_02_FULL_36_28]OHD98896.1 MAG: preprotein translocase subunit TatA [Sulfurimonas sp. RIFCSPHIGHO2_12_FULL_36_9]OHE01268.1 MAG: preprotein translocase subunit TatA [Sulfurimonas sp. RIFCSPLOWO2_12_36_12]OHE02433.1 MAG: preprotein translocase subunit TatA [Sulfurimonas sp. RIFCSPLOWO2_12_FULL_36_74]